MQRFISVLKVKKLNQRLSKIVASGLAYLFVFFALSLISLASFKQDAALAASVDANQLVLAEKLANPEQAADRAAEASDQIFEGLDTTKEIIGKTEPRKQAIEHARKHASEKLDDLADKARRTKDSDESLTYTEQIVVEDQLQ